jgi:hypothetical protein
MSIKACGDGSALATGFNEGIAFTDQPAGSHGIAGAVGFGKSPNRTGNAAEDASLNADHLLVEFKIPLTTTLGNGVNPNGVYDANATFWRAWYNPDVALFYSYIDPETGAVEQAPLSGPPDMDQDQVDDSVDNCAVFQNPGQENDDRNFVQQNPPKLFDDATWVHADVVGNPCDIDADNDGRLNTLEEDSGECGGGNLLPIVRDYDLDRVLDDAECELGFDPLSAASRPTLAQCGSSADSDLDGIADNVEFCYYNGSPGSDNTDRDICTDGEELATVDGNSNVNAADLGNIANASLPPGPYGTPPPPNDVWKMNMDLNKNGVVNSQDIGLAAAQGLGPCTPWP